MVGVIARNPVAAAATPYDLVVVGGGIHGVAIAHGATCLGLRPLLLERDDFGGATSWNSLRILHGGIRSLQTLDLPRCYDMAVAQRWFLRQFPEHVAPLECLMPLHGQGLRRPAAFRAALAVNGQLRRWWAVDAPDDGLPRGTVLDAAETGRRFPLVQRAGLLGGGVWYDALMRSPQRVLMDWLRWACAGGAAALNRVAARRLMVDHGRVVGVEAEDRVSGATLGFRAPLVINCAGPWSEDVARAFDAAAPVRFRPTLAFNLLLDRAPIARCAIAVTSPVGSRRTYFVVPWGERTLVGTYHDRWMGQPDWPQATARQVEQMILELNAAVPGWDLGTDGVLRVCCGLLHGAARRAPEGIATRELLRDHGRTGGPAGLMTVAGVKFTTAPRVAARVLRAAGFGARTPAGPVPRPPARPIPDLVSFRQTLSGAPERATAWIRELVAEESVLSVEDLLRRRTDWGLDPREERDLEGLIRPLLGLGGLPSESLTRARA